MRRILLTVIAVFLLMPSAASVVHAHDEIPPPDLTEQEEAFNDALMEQLETLGDSTITSGELFTELAGNPMLMFDEAWVAELGLEFAIWGEIQQDAQELEPSPRQQHLYVTWLEITTLIASSADDYMQLLDHMDTEAGDAGTAKVNEATELTETMSEDLLIFMGDPDVVAAVAEAIPSPVANCEPFADYNVAQVYYALHPEEQPVIDPNEDGRACEVFFGRDGVQLAAPAALPSADPTNGEAGSGEAPGLGGLAPGTEAEVATYYVYMSHDFSEGIIAVRMETGLPNASILLMDGMVEMFLAEFEADGLFMEAEEIPITQTPQERLDGPLAEFNFPRPVGDEMRTYRGMVDPTLGSNEGFAVFYAADDVLWLVMGSQETELELGSFLQAVMDNQGAPDQLEGFTLIFEEDVDDFD